LTLAGDVAGLRGARLVSGVVPGSGRHGYELSGGQRAADGAGRLLWRGRVWRSGGLRGQAASAGVMVMTEPGLSFCSCRIR
jgi:hypothetical protein